MPTPKVNPAKDLGFLVADSYRLMRRVFDQRRGDGSLPLAQTRALLFVSRHEGVCQRDLAERLDLQPMTLARSLDQLVAAGLVERRTDPADRRAFRIFLCPPAKPVLARIRRDIDAIAREALAGFSADEAALLNDLLVRLRDQLGKL